MKHSKTKVLLLSVSVVFVVVMLIVPLISVLANSLAEGWDFLRQSPDDALRLVGPALDPYCHGHRRCRQYVLWPLCRLGHIEIRLSRETPAHDPHRYSFFRLAGHRRPGLHHDLRPHGLDRSVDRSPERLLRDGHSDRLRRSRRHLGDDFRHLSLRLPRNHPRPSYPRP